jgi:MFS family permease
VQLLPGLAGDPFGAGWDLLGPAAQGLDADPLGAAGLLAAQLAVLGVGLVWGAVVAGRRSSRGGRAAAALVLGCLAAVASLVVSLH